MTMRQLFEQPQQMFNDIADWIEENPKLYDQDAWCQETECGTAYCIAGLYVMLAGYKFTNPTSFDGFVIGDMGLAVHCQELATEGLGLTLEDRRVLFDSKWEPREGIDVPMALRSIGAGSSVQSVSCPLFLRRECGWMDLNALAL